MADNRFTLETGMAKIIKTDLPWNSPHWHPAQGGIYRNGEFQVADVPKLLVAQQDGRLPAIPVDGGERTLSAG